MSAEKGEWVQIGHSDALIVSWPGERQYLSKSNQDTRFELTVAAYCVVAAWKLHGIDGELVASCATELFRDRGDVHRAVHVSEVFGCTRHNVATYRASSIEAASSLALMLKIS